MRLAILLILVLAPAARAEDCQELEGQFRLAPGPAVLMQIADCWRRQRDFQASSEAYLKFLSLYPDDPRAPDARESMAQVEREERRQRRARAAQKNTPDEAKSEAPRSAVLAVAEFKSHVAEGEIDAAYFSEAVRIAALRAVPGLRVLTREDMADTSGKICSGDCELQTARRVGADLVTSGEVRRLGSTYKLVLMLHDVRTGQLLSGADAQGKSAEELDAGTAKAVSSLLGPVLQRLPAAPTAVAKAEPPEPPLATARTEPAPAKAPEALPPVAPPPPPPPPPAKVAAGPPPVKVTQPSVPAPAVRAQEPAPAEPPASGSRTWTWIAGGAAAVALGAGGAFALKSRSTSATISGGTHTTADLDVLRASYTSQAHSANLLFGVAGGLGAISLAFFLLRF